MTRVVINGKKINVPKDYTVFQACQKMGLEIPHFCFHERLSIAGNCRMCLVQQKGVRNPIASCAVTVSEGMEIDTNSEMTKKARQGVMEFLLINHPLDCPICDQGGECDLQDQAMEYGRAYGRFNQPKRAVEPKQMGPLVQTYMTRCIHCTRCVRFATEVAGVEEIGAMGRGEDTEIINYVEGSLESELSGNIIDLCPVGALTSKPYGGTARSWELDSTETVDVLDAVGSNICVNTRGGKVMRILPRVRDDINEEWISDKTRFAYDGLALQRLDTPWLRDKNGNLAPASWDDALAAVASAIKNTSPAKIGAVCGDLCCGEGMFALLSLLKKMGVASLDCRQDGARLDASLRQRYLFNTTIEGIEDASACLLVGCNPRLEAPIINARLRKRWLAGGFKGYRIGTDYPLGWELKELGTDPKTLQAISLGKHPLAKKLQQAKSPMIIVGQQALARQDGGAILRLCLGIAQTFNTKNWNGFNVLHRAAARVAALDMGFVPAPKGLPAWKMPAAFAKGKLELLWLLGADELDLTPLQNHKKPGGKIIYQGHHGDKGAEHAHIILPTKAYTEKDGLYMNTEGRLQRGFAAATAPAEARDDWQVIQQIATRLKMKLGFNDLEELRTQMASANRVFKEEGILASGWQTESIKIHKSHKLSPQPITGFDGNFYQTDAITRASPTMAKCVANKKRIANTKQMANTNGRALEK